MYGVSQWSRRVLEDSGGEGGAPEKVSTFRIKNVNKYDVNRQHQTRF